MWPLFSPRPIATDTASPEAAAKRYESDLSPYATVMRVFNECMKVDAFDRAQPSKQPDAE